jgi:hypothetical protein
MLSTQSVHGYTANVAALFSNPHFTKDMEASNDATGPREVKFMDTASDAASPNRSIEASGVIGRMETRAALADGARIANLL